MNSLTILAVQIVAPLLLGMLVNVYLSGVTRHVLTDLCSGTERAEFWVRVVAILSTLAPLAVVLIFGRSPVFYGAEGIGDLIRHTISLSLIGILIAVAALARAVWKQLPTQPATVVPRRSA